METLPSPKPTSPTASDIRQAKESCQNLLRNQVIKGAVAYTAVVAFVLALLLLAYGVLAAAIAVVFMIIGAGGSVIYGRIFNPKA